MKVIFYLSVTGTIPTLASVAMQTLQTLLSLSVLCPLVPDILYILYIIYPQNRQDFFSFQFAVCSLNFLSLTLCQTLAGVFLSAWTLVLFWCVVFILCAGDSLAGVLLLAYGAGVCPEARF